ncbi:hypothetical protein HO173_001947 [Letharia columbiana]|uniref:ATP-dependent RNA helicase n=1 Tax=Letharia columbiana TaxID=112416 RepID=A0A8H6G4H6_9LECA|nr:uncharacterized protein HO173_001947 [Letharia columbiana]KAF6240336.1 hypothetical protein HO173_001947 [Letharia columbiana]
MSTSGALYSSASLKAANAQPYSVMEGKLDPMLLQALKDMNFDFMTPVQSQVLAGLPSLKSDCLVQAKTGTGKTTAFLLPAIQNTIIEAPRRGQVAVLILSPTRELALQIAAEASRLVSRLRMPLQVHTAFGGTAKASNLSKFRNGDPKILVATPGRLNDYLSESDVRAKFDGMKTLILDEADRMLDAGFLPDILKVLRVLPSKRNGQWQGMCFSATLPPKIQQVLSNVLKEDYVSISTIEASEPPTLEKVPQYSIVIPEVEDTFPALFSLIKEELNATEGDSKIIVFGTTANLVALYAQVFEAQTHLKVYELQSRLSQPARTKATDAFRQAKSGLMFATDVIGRGMDFPDVTLVLQVGLPADADSYTHRVGRTARAGKDGRAVLLLTQAESFFLKVNRQFPINAYPASNKILNDATSRSQIFNVLQSVEPKSKQKAYSAYLGFMKVFLNKMQIDATALVRMANVFAMEGMQCNKIPEMEKKTVGKMGLKGVPGIHYAAPSQDGQPGMKRDAPVQDHAADRDGPSRRLRHQGVPEPVNTFAYSNGFGVPGGREGRGRGAPGRGDHGMRGGRGIGRGGRGGGDHGMRGGRAIGRGGRGGGSQEKRRERNSLVA